MESRGKSVEREGKEQGLAVKKWKQGVALEKRRGPSTPPPTWRLELSPSQPQTRSIQEFLTYPPHSSALSARKLCACLWEIEPHQTLHFARMMSKSKSRHRQHKHHNDLGFEDFVPPSTVKPEEPAIAGCVAGQIAASPVQRHDSGPNENAFESATPETCSGSMEVAPYKPHPRGSFDGKGRIGGSGYSLQTSTELLKVLNRIWSLEEQHVSDKSMLKALNSELHQSHSRIKELVREKQKDRRIMESLIKELAEDKYGRKQREQERIEAEAELLREETEKERKLRKRSESLHRKLAKELAELKPAYSTALRELEREKKARILLENLCDEFAKGIRDYEQVVRSLKHGPIKESIVRESLDRLILHISEAWLDERMQMKLAESHDDAAGKDTVVDKLSSDIESFLQTKRSVESSKDGEVSLNDAKERCFHRHSLESFAIKEAGSAPPVAHDNDCSFNSDLQCFEQSNKVDAQVCKDSCRQTGANASHSHLADLVRLRSSDTDVRLCEIMKSCDPSTLPEACKAETGENVETGEENRSGLNDVEMQEMGTSAGYRQHGEHHGSNANGSFDHMIRSHSLHPKSARTRPARNSRDEHRGLPGYPGQLSPVQKWPSKVPLPEPGKIMSALRWPKGLKENTLMAKLLEARIEGQHSRSKAHKDTA